VTALGVHYFTNDGVLRRYLRDPRALHSLEESVERTW
jgi:hypothetical protein